MDRTGDVRILATGFGAFPGAPFNPSAAIVARLSRSSRRLQGLAQIDLSTAVLPVRWEGAGARLSALFERVRPEVVLLLGVAGRRATISVETRARNRLSVLRADADKRTAPVSVVLKGGPQARAARAPVARLIALMSRSGVSVRRSIDAGDYICNQVYYLALASEAEFVGFIHVPRARNPGTPGVRRSLGPRRWSVEEMTRAIAATLPLLASQVRVKRRASLLQRGGALP
jgi:pyroglutamyl-peptidase